jgi:hypothetical protein
LGSEESYAKDRAVLQIKRPVHLFQEPAAQGSSVETCGIVHRKRDFHSLRDALEGNSFPLGKRAAQGSMAINDRLEGRS